MLQDITVEQGSERPKIVFNSRTGTVVMNNTVRVPKSIGVGQYQHDVSQSMLAKRLDAIVEVMKAASEHESKEVILMVIHHESPNQLSHYLTRLNIQCARVALRKQAQISH